MAKKLTLEQTRYKLAKAHWDSVQLWERSQPCKFADCDCCQCKSIVPSGNAMMIASANDAK